MQKPYTQTLLRGYLQYFLIFKKAASPPDEANKFHDVPDDL